VSSASAAAALSLTLVLLTALLALSIVAIVRAEPWIPGPPEQESAGQFSQPEPMSVPHTPGVSGSPPWDPAPKPPGAW